ncbi:MAG: hypothetical protein HUJ26_04675 [Planctomycetaceae bacterium]|nr:hypothetical protein [Planctomycetaceae bacterium]
MTLNSRIFSQFLCSLLATAFLCSTTGCSLFVMAGKSLFGDPVMTAPFSHAASVDLTKGEHRVVIVASTPQTIQSEFPSTTIEMIEQVSRNLKANGVNVVSYNKVANWLDDNGGYWSDVDELANAFETEYIIHLDIDSMTLQEPNSPDMYEGRVSGTIYGYEVRQGRKEKTAHRIFNQNFTRKYPDGYPQLADRLSREEFHSELMEHICRAMAQQLYNHRPSDEFY